jgi:two-component system, NarL family, sensor kinase
MFPNTEEENLTTIILLGTIVLIAFVCFVILLAYLFTTKKNKLLQEKQLMKTQFEQELLQTQLEIQSQTLQTISQEIHDNVGQVLSLAKLNLGTFEDTESVFNQPKINDTKQLVSKAINDLRDLSRSLYGNKIAELGLAEAINNELKILQNSGQFKTTFKIVGEPFKLEPQKEMVVYRMLQESLNNAIKHSKAQNIHVVLKYDAGLFCLTITDDGIGFDTGDLPSSNMGMGLKSMQNRAALIGGLFSVISNNKKGTKITIEIKGTVL